MEHLRVYRLKIRNYMLEENPSKHFREAHPCFGYEAGFTQEDAQRRFLGKSKAFNFREPSADIDSLPKHYTFSTLEVEDEVCVEGFQILAVSKNVKVITQVRDSLK